MKILVIGAAGQLGLGVAREFGSDHEVIRSDQTDLDITDHGAVRARAERIQPAAIINCAAYNNVDGAEDNPLVALEVNAFAVRSLADAASRAGAAFVHFSTDFVFDGRTGRPYVETDATAPRSVYAASKLIGEWFARETPRHYVLRVESLFGGGAEGPRVRRSSVDVIIDALIEGREARVFADRIVSPSYVADVAQATRAVLERNAPPGLYHCTNSGACSWLDLGRHIVRLAGLRDRLVPVSVASVTLRADRPKYSALDSGKLASAAFAMPTWEDALARYLSRRLGATGAQSA